jgi:hypothetical protein
MTSQSKFWPLDYEPEDEIYENLSWDLPGLRRTRRKASANFAMQPRDRGHSVSAPPRRP